MRHLLMMAGALALVGCAQPGPKPLYQWAGYQPAVYDHLRANGADLTTQIQKLQAQVDKNQAQGEASPPGMRAHLALLYFKAGDEVAGRRYLEAERTAFPESAAYVDFVLKSAGQGAQPKAGGPTAGATKS